MQVAATPSVRKTQSTDFKSRGRLAHHWTLTASSRNVTQLPPPDQEVINPSRGASVPGSSRRRQGQQQQQLQQPDSPLAGRKDGPTRPLMNWLARKLGGGQGRTRSVKPGSTSVSRSARPLTETTTRNMQKRSSEGSLPRGILNTPVSPASDRQRTSVRTPSIRVSTSGRPMSTRTRNSGRSNYHHHHHHHYRHHLHLSPGAFSLSRSNTHRASFVTRSSASPDYSPTISPRSSSRSLASSYLGLDDPDSRSYVTRGSRALSLGDNASIVPLPPSRPISPAPSVTTSLPSSLHFQADLVRGTLSASASGNRSRSGSQSTTASSSLAPSKNWRSIATSIRSQGAASNNTKPTTIMSSDSQTALAGYIAQPGPPSIMTDSSPSTTTYNLPPPLREVTIHRTLTWDSNIPPSPTVPSPLGQGIIFGASDTQEVEGDQSTSITAAPYPIRPPRAFPSTPPLLSPPLESDPDHHGRADETDASPTATTANITTTNTTAAASTGFHVVPGLSRRHPRYNPHPSFAPSDDASMHTLASSMQGRETSGPAAHLGTTTAAAGNENVLGPPIDFAHEHGTPDDADDDLVDMTPVQLERPLLPIVSHPPVDGGGGETTDYSTVWRTPPPRHTNISTTTASSTPMVVATTPVEAVRPTGPVPPLGNTSGTMENDERASVIGLRRRRDSMGSEGSGVSRFSWAAGSVLGSSTRGQG